MTENSNVHFSIKSRQFNTLKSLLILAKIRNFASGAVVFGAFVSWGFLSLGLLSLGGFVFGVFNNGASVCGAFVHGSSVRAPYNC